ncbi:hypothetical protein M2272_000169 [Mycobacterium frederiksbergense]|uniref:Uncharacterized protein n=1 Tax=Mycolicibacterium frederiksbergense TaxID=117567 RepID=A0ABT6KSJ9_9MYCO|nr:hypothetical protein [Mycolicibacterium frederiksbergense]MDH6193548.1 hypothetical protein [Mycolicibacterium frederiksbergense]
MSTVSTGLLGAVHHWVEEVLRAGRDDLPEALQCSMVLRVLAAQFGALRRVLDRSACYGKPQVSREVWSAIVEC